MALEFFWRKNTLTWTSAADVLVYNVSPMKVPNEMQMFECPMFRIRTFYAHLDPGSLLCSDPGPSPDSTVISKIQVLLKDRSQALNYEGRGQIEKSMNA